MRITCPNCQATYEVGESDIPEGGIEVECSACLNRWMQSPKSEEVQPEPAPESPPVEPSVEPAGQELEGESGGLERQFGAEVELPEPDADEEASGVSEAREEDKQIADIAQIFREPVDAPETSIEETQAGEIEDIQEEVTSPSTGWRVPRPPEKNPEAVDPLDEILAEVEAEKKDSASESGEEPKGEDAVEGAPIAQEENAEPEVNEVGEPAEPETDKAEQDEPGVPEEEAEPAVEGLEDEALVASVEDESGDEKSEPEKEDIAPEIEAKVQDGLEPGASREPDTESTDVGDSEPEISGPSTPEEDEIAESLSEIGDVDEPEAEIGEVAESEDLLPEETPVPEESRDEAEEPEPEDRAEIQPEVPVAPVAAPHWSEAVSASKPDLPQEDAPLVDEAQKGMEDLIRNLSEGASSTPASPEAHPLETALEEDEPEEEPVHPWSGDVAPTIEDNVPETRLDESGVDLEREPLSEEIEATAGLGETAESVEGEGAELEDEDDDFSWEEPSEEEHDEALEFDPEPEEDSIESAHIAAIEAQNRGEIHSVNPEITNVIQAVIPQAPNATIPSRPPQTSRPKPGKPTPVESAEDIEAAIRAQMSAVGKPKAEPEDSGDATKSGIFGIIGRNKKVPEPEAESPKEETQPAKNPLKEALLEADKKERAPRTGKRTGFYLVVFLFLILLAVYLFGEQFAAWVPALAPVIDTYSNLVDGLRVATQKLFDSVLGG